MAESSALLLVSFGGPEGPDDVMPFLRNVTSGRGVPDGRLAAVAEHYFHFDGRSPINDQNRALLAALRPALDAAGLEQPLYWGNRNWHPLLADVVRALAADGHHRVVAVATSAWSSWSGCRQYREDLARAAEDAGGAVEIVKIRPFHDHPGFIEAQADRVRVALREHPGGRATPRLLFVAHSIPTAMADASSYADQVASASRRVVHRLGHRIEHEVAWCSRSGSPATPWLEPDVNDVLAAWSEEDVRDVVLVPIGFVSDHMEVIWDLDVEAAETAREHGIALTRAGTVGTHPAFVDALVDRLRSAVTGRPSASLDEPVGQPSCEGHCCLANGDAGAPAVAAI